MNSRNKLNAAHLYAALLAGAIAGALCQSWLVFMLVTTGIIGAALHDGGIRPQSSQRR
jgi:hypothetical protein